jgi:hypothetical protein
MLLGKSDEERRRHQQRAGSLLQDRIPFSGRFAFRWRVLVLLRHGHAAEGLKREQLKRLMRTLLNLHYAQMETLT